MKEHWHTYEIVSAYHTTVGSVPMRAVCTFIDEDGEECEAVLSWDEFHHRLDTHELLLDALEHCGYDPEDCIDCGGPPHNEWCRFWKLRHLLSYWSE